MGKKKNSVNPYPLRLIIPKQFVEEQEVEQQSTKKNKAIHRKYEHQRVQKQENNYKVMQSMKQQEVEEDNSTTSNRKIIYANGDCFEGIWINEEPYFGSFYFFQPTSFVTKEGFTFVVECGDILTGEWRNGKKQGIHVLVDSFGSQFSLLFKDDNLLCEIVDNSQPPLIPQPTLYYSAQYPFSATPYSTQFQ